MVTMFEVTFWTKTTPDVKPRQPAKIGCMPRPLRICPLPVIQCSFSWSPLPRRIGATPMVGRRRWLIFLTPMCLLALVGLAVFGQQMSSGGQYPSSLLAGLEWRDVGPMRGGRTYGVAGHANQPDTFYFGSVGGGVWKTENAGHTWFPISDQGIPIGSIGAIAVAPSNPNIVYVGTGEPDIRSQHSYGIGMFKSTDAGKTWTHIGLEATRQIGRVAVDPGNPNRVYVAALGHVYDPNPERGVYRSTDGGATWTKVLSKSNDPDNVGAIDLAIDPKNPRVLYASLWATRRPPWAVYAPTNLPGGGLHRSSDGGDTWKQLFGPSRPPGSSRRAGGYSPVFRLGSLTRLPGREPCPKKQILLDMGTSKPALAT